MAKVIAFDLDGTLTIDTEMHYEDLAGSYIYRKPNPAARELVLRAIKQGWTVTIWTARPEAVRRITEDWLHENGFRYHFLQMNKPYCTFFIDDRARSFEDFAKILGEECTDSTGPGGNAKQSHTGSAS